MKAIRRLGRPADDPKTSGVSGSPDVMELENGDFAIIGWDITNEVDTSLLPGVHWVAGEKIVRVDRDVLINARRDIPESL